MRNSEDYSKIKNSLIDSQKNGKIKYSMFVRSSLNEFQALSELFYLSEIVERLKEDTGINIIYNSFLVTYNRHRSKRKNVITKRSLKPSNSVPEFVGKSEQKNSSISEGFEWLNEYATMNEKLKEVIIGHNMTEQEFLDASINIHNPISAVKQIVEFARARDKKKSSSDFFNK